MNSSRYTSPETTLTAQNMIEQMKYLMKKSMRLNKKVERLLNSNHALELENKQLKNNLSEANLALVFSTYKPPLNAGQDPIRRRYHRWRRNVDITLLLAQLTVVL